jgi:hypothetical protein
MRCQTKAAGIELRVSDGGYQSVGCLMLASFARHGATASYPYPDCEILMGRVGTDPPFAIFESSKGGYHETRDRIGSPGV